MRKRLHVASSTVFAAIAVAAVAAQPATGPAFEVATVKRNPAPDAVGSMGLQPGGRFVMINGTALSLITYGFDLTSDNDVIGLPSWVHGERYDVTAKTTDAAATLDQVRLMVRALLAERFGLAARNEMRDQPIYALVQSRTERLGPQLRPAKETCQARRAAIAAGTAPPLRPPSPTGPVTPCTVRNRPNGIASGGIEISVLAKLLTRVVGRMVVDKTGLAGDYEFDLEFAPVDAADSSTSPSVFTALEEQLGLKLTPERGALPVLVVERINQPTAD